MSRILELSKYLTVIGVIFSLIASAAAFITGAYKTIQVIGELIVSGGKDSKTTIALIELMDKFLIATALYLFAVGLYELFIKELDLPQWLMIHNLHDLKTRLSSVIILVMAIVFLEHLVEWKDPLGTLFFGLAVAVVSASLVAFNTLGEK